MRHAHADERHSRICGQRVTVVLAGVGFVASDCPDFARHVIERTHTVVFSQTQGGFIPRAAQRNLASTSSQSGHTKSRAELRGEREGLKRLNCQWEESSCYVEPSTPQV
jgi:hypothetical protein